MDKDTYILHMRAFRLVYMSVDGKAAWQFVQFSYAKETLYLHPEIFDLVYDYLVKQTENKWQEFYDLKKKAKDEEIRRMYGGK